MPARLLNSYTTVLQAPEVSYDNYLKTSTDRLWLQYEAQHRQQQTILSQFYALPSVTT